MFFAKKNFAPQIRKMYRNIPKVREKTSLYIKFLQKNFCDDISKTFWYIRKKLYPPPADFLFVDGFWWFFFLSTPHHVYSPKHISFFFYDHYDVRYGHFSTSGVSKNHVFSSFWLTAFLLDFCPTFFWSKIDAWDNSYWNYISTCLGKIYKFVKKRHLWRHMTSSK